MNTDGNDPVPEDDTLFELIEAAESAGDSPDDEFSLEQLGAAYARVLRGESGPATSAVGSPDGRTDDPKAPSQDSPGPAVDPVAPPLCEADDDAACPINEESVLEAVLFVGAPEGTRLTAKKLASLMREISPKEIRGIVERLNAKYQKEHSAWRIVQREGGYRMDLIEELDSLRDGFLGEIREARLPQSAVDVLAVVAYHQPITRQGVEQIWLRPCGAILANLTQRKLLELEPGEGSARDRAYVTTDRFLQLLGLESLHDLPLATDIADLPEN